MRRITVAIGYGLSPDIRAEAISELALAVVEGTVTVTDIEEAAPRFRRRALAAWASNYSPRSLDATMNDYRLLDRIADHSSREWLEDMGATVAG